MESHGLGEPGCRLLGQEAHADWSHAPFFKKGATANVVSPPLVAFLDEQIPLNDDQATDTTFDHALQSLSNMGRVVDALHQKTAGLAPSAPAPAPAKPDAKPDAKADAKTAAA